MRAAALVLLLAAAACSSGADDGFAPLVGVGLQVAVSGLPAGTAAAVTVTGPDGRVRPLAASADLADLVPGSYLVAAAPVAAAGDSLWPAPAAQEVLVDGAAPARAAIAYARDAGGLNLVVDAVTVTQVVQSLSDSIPLVAGRDALVRVFVRASAPNDATPAVRLRLFHGTGSVPVRTWTIAAPRPGVPLASAEEDLAATWNQLVPGALLVPGARLLAEVDPEGVVPEGLEADNAFPRSGVARGLDVRSVPPYRLRFVPVRTARNGALGGVTTANHAGFLAIFRKLYPVADVASDVRATPYTTTTRDTLEASDANDAWVTILSEVNALRAAEGFAGTYYGVVRTGYGNGIAGMGYVPGRAAIGWDRFPSGDDIAAHELGHTLSLGHAPCGRAGGTDPAYPFADGRTGIVGIDVATMTVRPRTDRDIMGYCGSDWISAYHYLEALRFRQAPRPSLVAATAPEPGLLVWGRMADGRVELEPAFEVTAPPSLPAGRGTGAVELLDASGRVLWRAAFEGERVSHAPGDERHFAFVIPLRGIGEALAAVRVRGAAGAAERRSATASALGPASGRLAFTRALPDTRASAVALGAGGVRLRWDAAAWPMAMVRDAATGAILSFARGGDVALDAAGRTLDVTCSDGARSHSARVEVR